MSRTQFLKRYGMSWMIQDVAKIIGVDGKIHAGINNILSNQRLIPAELTLTVDSNTQNITVTTTGCKLSCSSVYKVVNI